eukprot:TRINITY_DN5148_c0_g2_i1.p2 TRINITY_DN5148_c0_g2~~TRINITY_DN5148_c0_g2_i1.p2  ORF type:complete len:127 (+),score=10.20 TRINITY_DN5148_c0_g2_i1:75-455(+)
MFRRVSVLYRLPPGKPTSMEDLVGDRYTRNYLPNQGDDVDYKGTTKRTYCSNYVKFKNPEGAFYADRKITNQDLVWADENRARHAEKWRRMTFMQKIKATVLEYVRPGVMEDPEAPARRAPQGDLK